MPIGRPSIGPAKWAVSRAVATGGEAAVAGGRLGLGAESVGPKREATCGPWRSRSASSLAIARTAERCTGEQRERGRDGDPDPDAATARSAVPADRADVPGRSR